jgi:hypothetical protein
MAAGLEVLLGRASKAAGDDLDWISDALDKSTL